MGNLFSGWSDFPNRCLKNNLLNSNRLLIAILFGGSFIFGWFRGRFTDLSKPPNWGMFFLYSVLVGSLIFSVLLTTVSSIPFIFGKIIGMNQKLRRPTVT